MDLEQLRYDIDEELRKEEYEEQKATAIANGVKKFWKKTKWRQFVQGIKCRFGRHLYNRIPSAGITTCPSCSRLWNNPYQGLYSVNGSLVGYGDFEKSTKIPRRFGDYSATWLEKGDKCEDEQKD